MKTKKKFVDELIRSLKSEVDDWEFGSYTADNQKWGISLWIANIPILNLEIYKPTPISFNLYDKVRIYNALSEYRFAKLIKLKSNPLHTDG